MGSVNSHKLKAEKASTIQKHRRQLRKIANLFRYIELCVVLVLISRLSFQLPVIVKSSSDYFHSFNVSPCFVFLVGNIIIITLLAQSGHFSAHGSERENPEPDFYQEFIQNSTKYQMVQEEQKKHLKKQSTGAEYPEKQSIGTEYPEKQSIKIECPKKQSISEYPEEQSIIKYDSIKGWRRMDRYLIKYPQKQSAKGITKTEDRKKENRIQGGSQIKWTEKQSTETGDMNITLEVKDYKRSQSDIVRHVQSEEPRRLLQRCETENNIKHAERGEKNNSYPEDGMSNDEFRNAIEAFIARQQRLRKQEQQSIAT